MEAFALLAFAAIGRPSLDMFSIANQYMNYLLAAFPMSTFVRLGFASLSGVEVILVSRSAHTDCTSRFESFREAFIFLF